MKKLTVMFTSDPPTAAKPPRPLRKGMSRSLYNPVKKPTTLSLKKDLSDNAMHSRIKSPGARSTNGHGKKLQHRTRSASTNRESSDCFGNLTNSQAMVLRQHWKYIYNSRSKATSRILSKLEHQCPKVKEIFYKAAFVGSFAAPGASGSSLRRTGSVNDHSKLVGKMLEDLFLNLQNGDKATSELREIGRKHAGLKQYGFSSEIWEKFGEYTLEVIGGLEGIQQNKEAARACRYLIAYATDELRYGYEQECKHSSRLKGSASVEIEHITSTLEHEHLPHCDSLVSRRARHSNDMSVARIQSAPLTDQRKFTVPARFDYQRY